MRDYNLERIANNIKKLRNKKNWKFSYVANKTNIEEKRLRQIEKALIIPNHNEIYSLSRLYKITIDALVLEEL
ncbi:helix-turn-helix transcriptional regulator [Clostridium sp.]|uniref:helix-turn-helix domain-containing protein n=1 Tax=Clostridium sp. TaxID=1506 RepID=UPI0025C574A7|nr:helix-turn-helix transcriptional regulator [Clostridium sp.]